MIAASIPSIRRAAAACVVTIALAFTSAPPAAAQLYKFDPAHTEIRFTWSHFGLSNMSGMILGYDGELKFDEANPENSALTITAKTASIWTHVDKLTEHLKAEDFFNAAKFPEISFKTTKIERTGEKTGRITGDLTIKGVTKPVTFDAQLNFKGTHPFSQKPSLGFSARTIVKRTEFDLGKYAPAVSDEIEITVETELNAAS
ncbi:MAG: polyisoprenoid-binding protein [Rhodomicrobium sp.]|nr:polyisoprenoid-binding protein [Rhodomicrobium sp.]